MMRINFLIPQADCHMVVGLFFSLESKKGIPKIMIDLHVHSSRSDGTYTPAELVDYAMEKGVSALALTDHDTVDGLPEMIAYADELRRSSVQNPSVSVPEMIPGIEFSTEYQGRDIHIVGLYINYDTPNFQKYLKDFVDSRTTRNIKMCALLQKEGIDITYEKLTDWFPGAVITRAHYAKYLLTHGYTKSMKEAFDRYIGDNCRCFVPREKVTPAQAVNLILEADGIPVLAHPILYRMSDSRLETLVAELKEAGLLGIEALYSTYNSSEERHIRTLAAKYHLLISGGSDFHGENKPGLDLGTGYGKLYVPDCILDDIKKCRKNLLFTDMDGTLLLNDSTISENMKNALNRMTQKGHRLIISSGRPLPSILEVCAHAGITYPGMFISAYNGALVYDCDAEKPVLEHKLSQTDISYIVSKAVETGIHIHGYTDKEIVCLGENAELRYYTRRIHMPLKCVKDIAAALPDGSYKLQTISLTDHEALVRFRDEILAQLGDRVQMIFSNEEYLEILPAAAGKGRALRFLASWLPAPHSHTFAAGDAENDISMLEAAHTGIAMLNATDSVKAHADIVTTRDNNADGLMEVLEKYFC